MKILIAGASGLVGSALVTFLTQHGHKVSALVRKEKSMTASTISWDPSTDKLDPHALEEFDAIINLSGENIASKRWNEARKAAIHDSRVQSTRLLAHAISKLKQPPRVLINASATGYYGNRGEETLLETSSRGQGFLAEVCRDWESAATQAQSQGVRVVCLRIGVVLSPKGGALGNMLPFFKIGLGGKIGSGKQIVSWIALDDLVSIFAFLLEHQEIAGPVNAVTPYPITNAELTAALSSALKRPAFLPMPAFAARFILGEMADELLLSSAKVLPAVLQQAGFNWSYPHINDALKHLLR